MARFANVAFSDGSLLDGFKHRIESDYTDNIKRFFITPEEAAVVLSTIFGEDICNTKMRR